MTTDREQMLREIELYAAALEDLLPDDARRVREHANELADGLIARGYTGIDGPLAEAFLDEMAPKPALPPDWTHGNSGGGGPFPWGADDGIICDGLDCPDHEDDQ